MIHGRPGDREHRVYVPALPRLCGLRRRDEGNSLIEVALIAPLMVMLVLYAVNFGYYFIVAINLTAAARDAAEYSIQGNNSPSSSALPAAGPIATTGTVAALAIGSLGNLKNVSSATSVEVCTAASGTMTCTSYGQSTLSYTADTDPESAMFKLNRVDIVYTITPPVPVYAFNMSFVPPATFHRMVEMRAIN